MTSSFNKGFQQDCHRLVRALRLAAPKKLPLLLSLFLPFWFPRQEFWNLLL